MKGQARLDILRDGGVTSVDAYLEQANSQMEKKDEEDSLKQSVRSDSNGCSEVCLKHERMCMRH